MDALSSGISAGQAIRQAPLIEAIKRQQLAQSQFQQQQEEQLAPLRQKLLEAQIASQSSGVDSERIQIEREKLRQRELEREQRAQQFQAKQGELKPGVQKILDASQTEAVESGARARQLGILAEDLAATEDFGAGATAGFSEFLKERLGTQDDVTELRRRFQAIRSSEAVQNLPPGVASDKDIELALRGFPSETANREQLISFLRGAEKLAKFRESFNRIKSELISEKGSTRGLLKEVKERTAELDIPVATQEAPPAVGGIKFLGFE